MKNSVRTLLSKRKTIYSQYGEDGFLTYLVSVLPKPSGWCVEFGAWDGQYLSNTCHLIKNAGYKAVLIEGDAQKHTDLVRNMATFPDVHCLHRFVELSGVDTLDRILSGTPIPKNFDVLSVDIDGNDYWVWKGLSLYRPQIVIIEINAQNLPDVEAIHDPKSEFQMGVSGTSIKSMTRLAHDKGYALVANVGCNAVYVLRELLHLFHKEEPSPSEVFIYVGQSTLALSFRQLRHLGVGEVSRRLRQSLSNRAEQIRTRIEAGARRS